MRSFNTYSILHAFQEIIISNYENLKVMPTSMDHYFSKTDKTKSNEKERKIQN